MVEVTCANCSAPFTVWRSALQRGQGRYCSERCQYDAYRARSDQQEAERFWSKVDVRSPDECWLWLGSRSGGGYGHFRLRRRIVPAHRAALILSGVELRDDEDALHTCDNPPCCNPRHLFTGTAADNAQDMLAKGRANRLKGDAWWTPKRIVTRTRHTNG